MSASRNLPNRILLSVAAIAAMLAVVPDAAAKDKDKGHGRGHAYGHDRGPPRGYDREASRAYDRGYDRGYQRDYGYRGYQPPPYRPAYNPPAGVSVFIPFR